MTTENPFVLTTIQPEDVVAEPVTRPIQVGVPRLAHGLVWSDVVAEIERDHEREQLRRAA
jgi:hypothetical protein